MPMPRPTPTPIFPILIHSNTIKPLTKIVIKSSWDMPLTIPKTNIHRRNQNV